MKAITILLVVLGLISLTFAVACEKKEEATTEAPAEEAGEQPSTDKPTEAPAEEKPAAAAEEKPAEGEPEAPPASQ